MRPYWGHYMDLFGGVVLVVLVVLLVVAFLESLGGPVRVLALAIGTGLAVLVIWRGWWQQVDMPWQLFAGAVSWLVLALPLYDRHRWPAKVFLILTALAVIGHIWLYATPLHCGPSTDMCIYAGMGRAFDDAAILIGWLVVGGLLAFIRFFIFLWTWRTQNPKAGAARHRTTAGLNATPGWDQSAWKTARPLPARAEGQPSEAE